MIEFLTYEGEFLYGAAILGVAFAVVGIYWLVVGFRKLFCKKPDKEEWQKTAHTWD